VQEVKNISFKESISIVIPLHNKELNIENTINSIVKYITAPDLQIIIVENESTDSSKIIAEKVIKNLHETVDISIYESKKGLGTALVEGFKHCKNKWIYFVPADFSFGNSDISYIEKNNLYQKYDIFLGSKTHKDSIIDRSKSREIYSLIFNTMLKILFSIPFSDTQGTLIFKSNVLKDINELNNKGFLITTEFIIKSFNKNKKILEVPIVDLGIKSISTVRPLRDGLKMLLNILKLRININR
tara:strand:+ start:271 stop:999 length:729 start_codon:yes stop_codon:yes gene_type:complete